MNLCGRVVCDLREGGVASDGSDGFKISRDRLVDIDQIGDPGLMQAAFIVVVAMQYQNEQGNEDTEQSIIEIREVGVKAEIYKKFASDCGAEAGDQSGKASQ